MCTIDNIFYNQMGNSFEKIQTCEIPESRLMYADPPLPHFYHPPFRKFLKVQEKKKARTVTYTLTITDPYHESIIVTAQVFEKLFDAYTMKTQSIFIEGIIKEVNVHERWVFLIDSNGNKQSLLIRPYTDETSHNFASILCQVYFTKEVTKLPCSNLHQFIDNYIIWTGMDVLSEPKSHIIVMEKIDATLSEIISFKREHLWNWTVGEFNRLVNDLVEAVYALHEAQITHNDIRPSTIYYSLKRKCYVLGSFGSCMKEDADGKGAILRTSSRRTISQVQSQQNRKQYDVHMLGMTLLSAFYLSEIIDLEVASRENQIMIQKYQILQLINAMIAPPEKRATIQQIKAKLPKTTTEGNYMQKMISSMKHRQKPTPSQAVEAKAATAFAYKHLGLWNQWKKQYQEAYQLTQTQVHSAEQAEGLMNLALIDHCRGDYRSSDGFAKEAALKYRELGKRQLEENSLGAAQSYYKKAVSCAKYYQLDPDPDLALSLSGLSLVHRDKGNFKYSMTLAKAASDVIAKADGKNTIQYGVHHLKEARLETLVGNFQSAEKIIEYCLTLANRLKQINHDGSIALKGQALVAKAKNYDRWAQKLPQLEQHAILDKGKIAAREAAQTYLSIEEDHHLELADVVRTVGLINIKRRNYYESIRQYTRAIQILETYEQDHHIEELQQKAEILCLRGTAHSFVGQYEEAVSDYLKALSIYKIRYGSHHNRPSALAIGGLGKIYTSLNLLEQARNCYKSCLEILNDVASNQDSDYVTFQKLERELR